MSAQKKQKKHRAFLAEMTSNELQWNLIIKRSDITKPSKGNMRNLI